MKILHLGKYFPPYAGGMETYLRDVMVALSKQNIVNAALVHQSDISFKSVTECYEAQGQRLAITRVAVWARLLFTPISPGYPWLLNRAIKQHNPDILHLHMPNVSVFWALLLPRARRIPWVVHWQSDVVASQYSLGLRLFYSLYRPFERAVLSRSKAIVATSPPYIKSSATLAAFVDKCHVIPLGLDPTNLPATPPEERPKHTHSPLRVLAIGRLTYYKGFEYLIKAIAKTDDVVLHLVGQGDQESNLKALTAELAVKERVTFHGHLPSDQLARQFSECDCLCLPSVERTESFGMVLLEAMQCGKATVVSNVPGSGMGWVVEHGVTGLHFTPGDVDELAQTLKTLQQDHAMIRALGKRAQQRFNQYFKIEKSATEVAELYKEVLSAKGNNTEQVSA